MALIVYRPPANPQPIDDVIKETIDALQRYDVVLTSAIRRWYKEYIGINDPVSVLNWWEFISRLNSFFIGSQLIPLGKRFSLRNQLVVRNRAFVEIREDMLLHPKDYLGSMRPQDLKKNTAYCTMDYMGGVFYRAYCKEKRLNGESWHKNADKWEGFSVIETGPSSSDSQSPPSSSDHTNGPPEARFDSDDKSDQEC